MEKQFKSFKQQHDEECYRYILSQDVPDAEMSDFIFEEELYVKLKNELVVVIEYPKIQTVFPFPYHSEIPGDIEEQMKFAKETVSLDYAIDVNTEPIDFMLKCLRQKPDMELGALYLVRENIRLPETTRFRIVRYFRTYPDMIYMGGREADETVLLKDADDRKALYSAYKKVRSKVVKELTERYEKYGKHAFEITMYNVD